MMKFSAEPGRRKAYANDLRWRIVYQRIGMDLPFERIARNLNVSISTAYRINTRYQSLQRRRPDLRRLDDRSQLFVVGLVLANPSLYLNELCHKVYEVYGVNVSPSTICRTLMSYQITRKKVRYIALQRCDSFRGAFMAQSFMFSTDKFVWIDETGSDARDQARKYGYALRGQAPVMQRFHSRGRRTNAMAAICTSVCLELTTTTVNQEVFFDFIRGSLIPNMMAFNGTNPRSIAMMDNLSVHHVREVLDLFHQAGILVLFLPPYSPDLNPMEEAFSYVKSYLRKHDELLRTVSYQHVQDIIRTAFLSITATHCKSSWIYHSGYNTC